MNSETQCQPETGTTDWNQFAKHRGRVLHRESVAKNVHLYIVEKPDGFDFRPGQAVELAIDEEGWREKKRPFTMTSLPTDPRLEFIVKSYPTDKFPEHDGMTERLGCNVQVGDRVIFGEPWGAIQYQGPGVFIAGGAGITPFVAILRHLHRQGKLGENRLFFSNQSREDVFLQGELFRMLGHRVVCTLTDQEHTDFETEKINADWLASRVSDFDQYFYVCGPPTMVEEIAKTLVDLGASKNKIIHEES